MKKLVLSVPLRHFHDDGDHRVRLTVLPMTLDDCVAYEQLPFPDTQHRDPFDRMIVVHALRNGLSVVGVDVAFDPYGVTRLW